MQCNIDSNGARLRMTWGVMAITAGLLLGGLALWSGIWWLWVIVGICLAAGSFAVFESRKKWCALRAMGVKTPV